MTDKPMTVEEARADALRAICPAMCGGARERLARFEAAVREDERTDMLRALRAAVIRICLCQSRSQTTDPHEAGCDFLEVNPVNP